jgi:ubiquinone/menaquinone biosynthesis C-methylase UbiE
VKQSEVFLDGEAEEWFARNQAKLPQKDDPVMAAIEAAKIEPERLLEVGCSNGWRVKAMEKKWKCTAYGVDPFFKNKLWNCRRGTADDLSQFGPETFDLVIYGWCLYLCDRDDLFKIVTEGDRVLKDGGHLVVYDFHTSKPHKRKYKHHEGLFSYKMDHASLWTANPIYKLRSRQLFGSGDDQTSITILQKDMDKGWPIHD